MRGTAISDTPSSNRNELKFIFVLSGKESLASLEKIMLEKGEAAAITSGRQEFFENLINEFI